MDNIDSKRAFSPLNNIKKCVILAYNKSTEYSTIAQKKISANMEIKCADCERMITYNGSQPIPLITKNKGFRKTITTKKEIKQTDITAFKQNGSSVEATLKDVNLADFNLNYEVVKRAAITCSGDHTNIYNFIFHKDK